MAEFIRAPNFPATRIPQDPRIQKPILQVKFSDEIPDAFERLTTAFGEIYHLFLEPKREAITEVIDETATREGAFDSLITAVGELCPPSSPLYFGTRRLLESPDPKSEIDVLFNEFKASHGTPSSPPGVHQN